MFLLAVVTAGAAGLSGLAVVTAVVLVAWVTDPATGASTGQAVRAAADAWLLAHGGTLRLSGGAVAVVPLGLTGLPAVLLYRSGTSLARSARVVEFGSAARATAALACGYGLLAGLVATLGNTATTSVSPLTAGIGASWLAALAGGLGVLRGAVLTDAMVRALPATSRAVLQAAAVAVVGLLAVGAGVVAVSLVFHLSRASALTRSLQPGLVGGFVLLLVGVLLTPNAAIWGTAYVAGPGFAVGAGTGVSPFGVALGPVPALPLLASLPAEQASQQAMRTVLVLPLLAGVLAGVVLARQLPSGSRRARRNVVCAVLSGLLSGIVLAALCAVAGGPVGGGYLATVGPSPWQVGLAIAVEVGVPATLVTVILEGRAAAQPDE